MNLTPIKLEDATAPQRLNYARVIMGLDVDEAASDEQVIAKIRAGQPGLANIFVEAVDEEEQIVRQDPDLSAFEDTTERITGSLGRNDPRAIIRIMAVESEDGSGNDDVPVGVNGVVWQLKRGMDLDVPWRVVEALGLTVQSIVRHNEQGEVTIRDAVRVPMSVIRHPSQEDVDAWHKAVDSKFCP